MGSPAQPPCCFSRFFGVAFHISSMNSPYHRTVQPLLESGAQKLVSLAILGSNIFIAGLPEIPSTLWAPGNSPNNLRMYHLALELSARALTPQALLAQAADGHTNDRPPTRSRSPRPSSTCHPRPPAIWAISLLPPKVFHAAQGDFTSPVMPCSCEQTKQLSRG